jgi:hypothetical protein
LFGDVFGNGDVLDFRALLAASGWDGNSSDIGQILSVENTALGLSVQALGLSAPGIVQTVAVLHGVGPTTLDGLLAHALT